MPYRVTRSTDGRPRVVLEGEPAYCRALAAAPAAREPELDAGLWLVMVFPVWSVPDVAAIQVALDAAGRLDGRVRLGVRPYDDPEEHRAWCPGLEEETRSPLWLLLRDGEVTTRLAGLLGVDELVDAVVRALDESGARPSRRE